MRIVFSVGIISECREDRCDYSEIGVHQMNVFRWHAEVQGFQLLGRSSGFRGT